jgi:hypothetical protein
MLKTFASPAKNNYFAPEWRFDFYETQLDNVKLVEEIRQLILVKEQEIIQAHPTVTHDGGTGLGPDSLTARFPFFNIFNWTEEPIVKFQQYVKDNYYNFLKEVVVEQQSVYIGCWANVMRFGQRIQPHWHSCFADSYIGGHFIVATENTSTLYQNPHNPNEQFIFENKPGDLTFFPSYLMHWTNEYFGNSERITIAFDIVTENYIKKFPEHAGNYIKFD